METFEEIAEAMNNSSDIYCGKCLKLTKVEARDYGIGYYEYGAGSGVHSDVCFESSCCDSEDLLLEGELPQEEEEEFECAKGGES